MKPCWSWGALLCGSEDKFASTFSELGLMVIAEHSEANNRDVWAQNLSWRLYNMHMYTMEYGSTPYIGMALKKMAATFNVYKVIC